MTNRTRGDEGSALIMALVMTMALSIILAAVLTLVQASQSTTVALRSEAKRSYEVDGAIQQAINAMQRGRGSADDGFKNEDGQQCFRPEDTSAGVDSDVMVIPDAVGTGSVAVVCSGTPGSGVQSPDVPITSVNKPGNAILTLGSTEGLYLNSTYNLFNRFDVGGPVFSNGPIRTNGRSLTAREYVIARGSCSDPAKITPSGQCNYGSTFDTRGVDPNYSLPSIPTAYPTLPTRPLFCTGTVTFEPGYYDDAAALNAITDKSDILPGLLFCKYHFKPGIYYFDFHNGDNSALPSSSHEWRVTGGRLIAGTRPTSNDMDCLSPLKSTDNKGVRFIFGGNSRLTIDGGSAAICGIYSATAPAVAIHGVKTGTETTQSANNLVPTGQSGVSQFVRNPTDTASTAWQGLTQIDSITAKWNKTTTNSQTGYLETTGFAPPSAVPAGSVIDSATVHLRRSNAAAVNADVREVVLTVAGNSCTLPVTDTASATLVNADLNVLTLCPAAFVKALHASGVPTTGTRLRYNLTTSKAGTELVDLLSLDVTYRAPAYRSQQNAVTGDLSCALGDPYVPTYAPGATTGCAALDLHSQLFSIFRTNSTAIHGTVYTPHASVAMQMDAVALSALRSGVISRSLYVQATGILNYATVAAVPFSSQGTDPSAYLTAYRCETTSTCSQETGVEKVRAKVTLIGQTTNNRRAAKIVSYSVLQ